MKRLIAAALILCLLAALAGCHGSRSMEPFQMPESFDTSREYEITFWAKNDSNSTQVAIYRQAIADFQALYPNITVTLGLYTDYARIYQDVITNISTNTTPNVCITYPDHIATYMAGQHTVVPLDALLDHAQYGLGGSELRFDGPTVEELVPEFLQEGKIGDRQYALPYMRSTEACYVNKTYVEKLGFTLPETLTWDFVWEVSRAAMEKNADGTYKVNGQNVLIPFIYKSTDNMMIQVLKQQNAGYSTPEGDVLLFNPETDAFLQTVAEHVELDCFNTFKRVGYPANFLNAGQCIFAVDSTAGATWMGSEAPLIDIPEENLVTFETVVMTIPQYVPESPQMISQGPSMCVFNKEDPQEVLASWLFAQYMLTDPVQIAYAQTEGYVPVTRKAQESAEYQEYLSRAGEDGELHYRIKLDATKLLLDNTENTFVTPVFNGSASVRDAAGHLIESVTKTVQRGQTLDQGALQKIYGDTISLHRLNQLGNVSGERTELGPLPVEAVLLLSVLGAAWLALAVGAFVQYKKRKRKNQA